MIWTTRWQVGLTYPKALSTAHNVLTFFVSRVLCVVYKEPVFEALTYDIALEHMVQIGYPESIRGLKVPSVPAREFESAPPCAFARG